MAPAQNFDVFDFELTAEQLSALDALDKGVRGGPEPEQAHANAAASGVELSPSTLEAVDEALGETPVRGQTLAPMATEGVMHR